MANYGLKISTPNKNVLTSIIPRDFTFWSKYPPLMITKYGKDQIVIPAAGTATKDIIHGLSYAPIALKYYEIDNNGKFWLEGTRQGTGSVESSGNGVNTASGQTVTDRYKLTVSGKDIGVSGFTMPFRYILLNDSVFDPITGKDKPVGYTPVDYGIKMSKFGVNVFNSKLYEQLFNSNCDFLKFHSTQVLKFTFSNVSSGQSSKDFIHGLNFVPIFLVYGYFDNDIKEQPLALGHEPQPFVASAYANTNKITVEIVWAGSPSPSTINFYARVVVFKNNMLG